MNLDTLLENGYAYTCQKSSYNEEDIIKFYRVSDQYGFLSNFYKAPFELNGYIWPTSEHYFQAMKFEGTQHFHQIRELNKPMEAAKTGRRRDLPLRKDWEKVKDTIMLKALLAKFSLPSLQSQLLETKKSYLIEDTTGDYYWGSGTKGTGKNMLGLLLMATRNYYRHNK